jgi:hypothetical protein
MSPPLCILRLRVSIRSAAMIASLGRAVAEKAIPYYEQDKKLKR